MFPANTPADSARDPELSDALGGQERIREARWVHFAWSFPREIVKDCDIFVHGIYIEFGLPRLAQFRDVKNRAALLAEATIPIANVVLIGAINTVNDRFAVFGSYNFGTTGGSPHTIAVMGFALAF